MIEMDTTMSAHWAFGQKGALLRSHVAADWWQVLGHPKSQARNRSLSHREAVSKGTERCPLNAQYRP